MLCKGSVSPMVHDMLRRSPVPCETCDRNIGRVAFRIFVAERIWNIEENIMFCKVPCTVIGSAIYKKYRKLHRNSVVCPLCLENMLDKQWESF